MLPDDVQGLIDKEQAAMKAFDKEIQEARDRDKPDMIPGLENQRHTHETELARLQTSVLPQAQKEAAEKQAKEAAEKQKEKDGSIMNTIDKLL